MPALPAKQGFTFGCDPELFVFKDGKPVPADMIPGSKTEPYKVEGGAVQRDGFAAEFNIDPVSDYKAFTSNVKGVMKQLAEFLPKGKGYTLEAVPSVVFDKDVFDAAEDDVKELGCMPDFNAWTGEINPPPVDPDNPYMRSAAGHLHIGWTEGAEITDPQHVLNCCDLVKQLDWYIGAWSVTKDADPVRRRLYGKAGACRLKDYGVEYRVPSNFWVTESSNHLAIWNRMQEAINRMPTKDFMPDRGGIYNNLLIKAINATTLSPDLLHYYRYPISTIDHSRRGLY